MAGIGSLPLFHRIAGQEVLVLGDGPAAEPKRRLVERSGGIVIDDMARAIDTGVRLAFVAYEDARAAENAAINLRCAGLLVNVVDMPHLCDFTTPSILDRNPVLLAIGTSGASAGLAKHVRLRLEALLPPSLARLAERLRDGRDALRARLPDGADRRAALDAALGAGGPLDPLDPQAPERFDAWMTGELPGETSRIEDIVLASDDPEGLTLRQARLLGTCDVLRHDPFVPEAVLSRARADALRRPLDDDTPAAGLTVILRRQSSAAGSSSAAK